MAWNLSSGIKAVDFLTSSSQLDYLMIIKPVGLILQLFFFLQSLLFVPF
jgi:hypothetical protein